MYFNQRGQERPHCANVREPSQEQGMTFHKKTRVNLRKNGGMLGGQRLVRLFP